MQNVILRLRQFLQRCRASVLKHEGSLSAPAARPIAGVHAHSQSHSRPRDDPQRDELPVLDSGATKLDAPLEKLPAEVRRQLLCMLELDQLRALVSVSPVFHEQYMLDRRFILCKCLDNTLRDTAVDAWAVYHSGQAGFLDRRNDQAVMELLQTWQKRSGQLEYSLLSDNLTEDEAVSMVDFHSNIITPLARHYVSWALGNLANESETPQGQETLNLSKTERARLIRAFYRFQLCCNLFGGGYHETVESSAFEAVDILKMFFCIFEPWQIEEIACIYAFTKAHHDEVFREVAWDLSKENPGSEDGRASSDGVFDLEDDWTRDSLLQGTTSCGLKLLHTVLFRIQDHAHLVSVMRQNISWPAENFLGNEALGERAQFQRRQDHPMERDLKQRRRDPLPFKGDREPGVDGDYPPLAWTLIWRDTYSNIYGYYVQDHIRRWGYVFWDAPRLERTGGKDVLLRQWEADWGQTDPRDLVIM